MEVKYIYVDAMSLLLTHIQSVRLVCALWCCARYIWPMWASVNGFVCTALYETNPRSASMVRFSIHNGCGLVFAWRSNNKHTRTKRGCSFVLVFCLFPPFCVVFRSNIKSIHGCEFRCRRLRSLYSTCTSVATRKHRDRENNNNHNRAVVFIHTSIK